MSSSNDKFLKHIGVLYHSEKIRKIADEQFQRLSSMKESEWKNVYGSEQEDRMAGAVLGLTWGDVAGQPVEGWRQDEIEKFFGDSSLLNIFDFGKIVKKVNQGFTLQNIIRESDYLFPSSSLIAAKSETISHEVDVKKNKRKKSPFESFLSRCRFVGAHTDDSQTCMSLINSIIEYTENNEDNKYFGEIWSKWLVKGYETTDCLFPTSESERELIAKGVQAFRDYGQNSSKAFTNMKKNIPAHQAGSSSSGIGGIMRGAVAPTCFALFNGKDEDYVIEKLEKFSMEQCLTTHATIEGAATCFATSLCAYKFIELGQEKAIEWILENLVRYVRGVEDRWWNERGQITIEEKEEEPKEEKKKKKREYKPTTNTNKAPESSLKWKIYKTLPSVNAASECLEVLFEVIKTTRGTSEEPTLLKKLREKVSELAKTYRPEKPYMKAHVNQGFCLLAGMHALCCALLPENPEIVFYYHKVDPTQPTPNYDTSDIMNSFPNLILRSVITLGYDTDTIGAIVGYLLGSRFGTNWIPMTLLFDYERIRDHYVNNLLHILRRNKCDSIKEGQQVSVQESIEDYLAREQFLSAFGEYYQHGIVDQHVSFKVNESNKHIYGNSKNRVELHSLENK